MTSYARVKFISSLIITTALLSGCDNSGDQQAHAPMPQVTVHVVNNAPLSITTELPGRTHRIPYCRSSTAGQWNHP
ncbi:Acriflavine resistance protein A precursor [Kluyvera cryocrescens]|uniref:Acriflavine resistance protein A n=1 Tax=Kluyvera cryocrescens TaxID=580 RepID=A0A485AEH3_KLUCR|nr:Acriflavine resistance protein A precursor [Kluyvera cryocrescens]